MLLVIQTLLRYRIFYVLEYLFVIIFITNYPLVIIIVVNIYIYIHKYMVVEVHRKKSNEIQFRKSYVVTFNAAAKIVCKQLKLWYFGRL